MLIPVVKKGGNCPTCHKGGRHYEGYSKELCARMYSCSYCSAIYMVAMKSAKRMKKVFRREELS